MTTDNKIIDLSNIFKDFNINLSSSESNAITAPASINKSLKEETNQLTYHCTTGITPNSPSPTLDETLYGIRIQCERYGGGSNTNKSGLLFEQNTCLYSLCKTIGFIDNTTYNCKSKLSTKQHNNKVLTCCTKNSFKKIVATKYQKDMYREPDDALIIDEPGHATTIYIIEKKAQFQSGSIDEKLFAIKYYLEDYKLNFGADFNIKYILCMSSYLWDCIENPVNKNGKSNKWKNYKQLMASPDIFLVNGDNDYESQIKNIIPELNI
jgi:hypothetical protein